MTRVLSLCLAVVAMLSACARSADEVRAHHEAATAEKSATAAPVVAAPLAKSSDAEFVAAVGMSKVSMPITVRFRLGQKPVVGKPVVVEVDIAPQPPAQLRSLHVHFQPGDGLELQGDLDISLAAAAATASSVRREFTAIPMIAGVLEISANAAVETPAESLAQVYAIPLIAAAAEPVH